MPHKCLATNARSFNEILAPRKFIYRLLGYHLIGFSIIDTPIIEITRGELNHGCVRPRSIHAIRTRTCNLQVSIETNGNVCVTCVPVCHVHNSWPHRNFHKNLTFLFWNAALKIYGPTDNCFRLKKIVFEQEKNLFVDITTLINLKNLDRFKDLKNLKRYGNILSIEIFLKLSWLILKVK